MNGFKGYSGPQALASQTTQGTHAVIFSWPNGVISGYWKFIKKLVSPQKTFACFGINA